ncbi:hypothetical protein [Candidatus Odyssella thessalonicensis]|uniref:hypothetical protein n=1 Tax=Candidatus Odyssella thessalonicensis TaxID=84647 RepID=UPI000527FA97|nr:hypothetical protein [Candidatus Odyssella thessalonicensis]
MLRFLWIVILVITGTCYGTSSPLKKLPTFQEPYCPANLNKTEQSNQHYQLAIKVYKASQADPFSPNSLWNHGYLESHPKVKRALTEFLEGKRGQALKAINLTNKTPHSLHQDLIAAGFTWKEVALSAGRAKFWQLDGSKTSDPNSPTGVKMQIYIHKDGSMVRIKSRGIPDDSGHYPQRAPQVIQAVLIEFDPDQCTQDHCPYNTDYFNEAFKVTAEGSAVPKSPSPRFGFKPPVETLPSSRLQKFAGDVLMSLVHTELKTDCR